MTHSWLLPYAYMLIRSQVVHYELKDTGMHILSCLALYTDPSGEKKHFKKFYKFQARARARRGLSTT